MPAIDWNDVLTKLLAGRVSLGRTGNPTKSHIQVPVFRSVNSIQIFTNLARTMASTSPVVVMDDSLAAARLKDAYDILGAVEWTATFRDNSLDVEANRLRQDLRHLMQSP